MPPIVLKNATIMTSSGFRRAEMLIDGPYIAKIDTSVSSAGAHEIDCKGNLVLPGLIDAHVHFRQPGMEQKATIYSESRAAALGGVTSYMEMPNTNPPTTTAEALQQKKDIAKRDSLVNYGFYLGASENNLEEIKKIDPHAIAGIKIYMGSTTGNLLLDDDHELMQVFKAAPTIVAVHCEDNGIVNANMRRAREQYGEHIPFDMHPIIRSRDCCVKSSQLAIAVAQATNARLHIMHLSTKEEVALVAQFAPRNAANTTLEEIHQRQISAEVCIPHLYFNDSNYTQLKGFLKCNPAVKYEFDRLALVQGLRKGVITTIGTDHAPHEKALKELTDYVKVPSGLPSVQFSLPAIFELFKRDEFSLEEGIKAATCNVAARFGVEKRGSLQEGYFADVIVVDPRDRHTVHEDDIVSLCKWSPFVGESFRCRITHSIVSGNLVVSDGAICADGGQGEALYFNP